MVKNIVFAQGVANPDEGAGGEAASEEEGPRPFIELPGADKFDLQNFAIDEGQSGTQQAKSLAYRLFFIFRNIIGTIAIFFIVFAGFRLVVAGGNEEELTTQKRNMTWALIGLALLAMAGELAAIFEGADIIQGPNVILRKVHIFDSKVQLLVTFIKYILGSIAVIQMALAGVRMITSGDQEEMVTKSRKNILYGAIGLLIVFISNAMVNRVLYRVDTGRYLRGGVEPMLSVSQGVKEIVGITNILVTIAAPIAILVLIVGAIMYLTSMGEEDKLTRAKKIMFHALIALVVIYGAFAIVTTVVSGDVAGLSGAASATAN